MGRDVIAQGVVTIRAYDVIYQAVLDGLAYGVRRLYKHDDAPLNEDALAAKVDDLARHVMDDLCEVLDFGSRDDE